MKNLLITSGYPRSGNTYLNYALHALYYPKDAVNINRHTIAAIQKTDKIIVPFRNPLDAIASWHLYDLPSTQKEDIDFYIRFHTFVLDNLHKIILMDFDFFTVNLDYITNKISTHFETQAYNNVSSKNIKNQMLLDEKYINLPRNNKLDLQTIKNKLQQISAFDKCLEIYAKLKTL